jgi:hypothetical protein
MKQESFVTPMRMFARTFSRQTSIAPLKNTCISVLVAAALITPVVLSGQQTSQKSSFGIAWRVIGAWRIAGSERRISDGDLLPPTALLQPLEGGQNHSVTILLPDGQRVLYECFTARDCERGFRVPSLYRKASPIATDLLARVGAAVLEEDRHRSSTKSDESTISRDEAAVLIKSGNTVEVGGLAAALSDGTYSYVIRSASGSPARESHGTLDKHGRFISFAVPAEGLFDVVISDRLNTPRIDLLLAAVRGPHRASIVKSFQDVEALLKEWNENYQGWPTHEFRRAYLRSVMLGIEPASPKSSRSSSSANVKAADAICEPKFEPAPGVFKTDTEVKLGCGTPGATIRYTVDGSQPLEGAAEYHAPIVVKGTALMIKAFASAPGKKDSPVVTGIYRIGE